MLCDTLVTVSSIVASVISKSVGMGKELKLRLINVELRRFALAVEVPLRPTYIEPLLPKLAC